LRRTAIIASARLVSELSASLGMTDRRLQDREPCHGRKYRSEPWTT
jgi:hypothetical protein